MSSLNNNFINKTFNSLLKLFNNESFTGTTTHTISDGLGNTLPVSFSPNTTEFTGMVCADTIVGGTNNNSSGTDSGILGGTDNRTLSNCSSILGGDSNTTLREYSSILGGSCNITNEAYSIIGGGCNNTTEGAYSVILGGQNNYTNVDNTFIIGSNITATTENTLYVENISINGDILDFTNNVGITGQLLSKGSDGLEWTNINTILTGNNVSIETFVVYTSNTNTLINSKLNITDFSVYSSNTNTLIGTKVGSTDFFSYTAETDNKKLDKTTFWDYTASTANSSGNLGTAFTESFYTYTATTKTQIDSKVDYSTFTEYTATTNTRINNKVETSTYNTFVSNTNGCLGTLTSGLATKVIEDGGNGSTIRINNNNQVQSVGSSVLGGCNNTVSGNYGFIGGGIDNTIGSVNRSTIVGGVLNRVSGNYSLVGAGNSNTIDSASNHSVIVGGNSNYINVNSECSFIGGGLSNTTTNCCTFIGGGKNNTTNGIASSILGGFNNRTCGLFSTISGGYKNTASGEYSTIVGGCNNKANCNYSNILGGQNNIADTSNTFILGSNITTSTPDTTYVESLNINSALYDNGSFSGSTGDILSSTGTGVRWCSADNLISGSTSVTSKLSLTDFYTYTSNTNNLIGTKLNISDFSVYSSNTNTLIGTKLNITDFSSYSSNTNTLIGTKYDKAGGIISGDVTITGSLTLLGTGNTINVQNSVISSPILLLASGSTLATLNAGLLINRATTGSTAFIYKENLGEYQLGYTTATTVSGLSEVNFDSYGKLRLGGLYTTNIYDYTDSSGSVNDVLFSTASGVEWGNLNYKLNVSDFNSFLTNLYSYTSNTNNLIGTKLDTSTFNTFTNSFYSYSANTNDLINTKYDKSGGTITGSVNVVGNISGNTFYGIGGNTILGTPSDNSYNDGLLGLTSATTINNAVDQIDEILSLLAPAKPPRLDASSWISPGYSLVRGSRDWPTGISGQTINNVIFNNARPLFRVTGGTSGTNTGFWNGVSGTLSFSVNGTADGSKALGGTVLTSPSNNGTDNGLTITDNDYYLSQTGKAGFWAAINATGRTSNPLPYNVFTSHTYTLTHSETGTLPTSFYIDNPGTPSVTTPSVASGPTITRYVSGVPSLASGDILNINYTVNNAISKFYTNGTFATLTPNTVTNGTWGSVSSYSSSSFSTPPLSGASISLTNQTITTSNNRYGETLTTTATGYNANGTSGTSSALSLSSYRVDTVSNEVRFRNAANVLNPTLTPNSGYNVTYDKTQSINSGSVNDSYYYELQMLNGQYQIPTGNYATQSGPNYSSVGSQTRYVVLTGGTVVSALNASIILTNTGGTWTGVNGITDDFYIFVRVDGSSGTVGWVDANKAWVSGNPTNNNDGAFTSGGLSVKNITFGTAAKTGTIYVRVGLPNTSNKKFGGINLTYTT